MEMALKLKSQDCITNEEKQDIEKKIEKTIEAYKGNSFEINRLVFDSITALTASESRSIELVEQGIFKRFLGTISGKNQKLQSEIDNGLDRAQYASQQTLQKLAEQNLMSFELITAVNNKLNSSIVEIESEINNIYGTLITFFKQSKSDLIQIETRVERLERNVNLLNWQNSIEYQMWDGIEYAELDEVSKIVCLVRDFYDITKGEWTTSDLLLLKTAMSTIELFPKGEICYKDFIVSMCSDKKLKEKLFQGFELRGIEKYSEYIVVTAAIQKRHLLDKKEYYIIDSVIKLLKKHGCYIEPIEVKGQVLEEYEMSKAKVNINSKVNLYDFVLELLYNLEQIKEIQYVQGLDEKMKEAEMLFSFYEIEKVLPLLQRLLHYGYTKAKYILALIYETGYTNIERNYEKVDQLLNECISEGYVPALVRSIIPLYRPSDDTRKQLIIEAIEELKKLANSGDAFACEELARCCINYAYLGISDEDDYKMAIKMFMKAPLALGKYGIAKRYDNGNGVEKDYKKSFELYMAASNYGYADAEYNVGIAYENGYGCDVDKSKAFEYYDRAERHGNYEAINKMGWFLTNDTGIGYDYERAYEYFLKGAKLSLTDSTANLGWCYHYGKGVEQDVSQAVKYYEKAIEIDDNYAYAYRQLGWVYLEGTGLDFGIDRIMAKEYFEKAASLGDENAKQALRDNY